ncbi:MAG: MBOAT family O-acyltransferase [Verrucomicrobiales bacterium]
MIFTTFEFLLFFMIVLGVRQTLSSFPAEKWFLLIASYLFYMSWSIPCGALIFASSIVDYWVGLRLGRLEDPRKRKFLLVVSIVINLGFLGFFKYTNFLLDNLEWGLGAFGLHVNPWHYDILLPVGVSFFTFQSMSYTIDVYRREIDPCRNLRDFLLFVSFFPQLVAGPIVRAKDFLPQLYTKVRASAADVEAGLAQFAVGAVKKCVISDQIAPSVDLIYASPSSYDGLTLFLGALGYSVQIYCDFSGYSDMAIGCARIMGYRFLENFQMPYSAVNITEFWRRWHISLSSWFRDYVYIPLGGNRQGIGRTYCNLLVTMLLCGLWHGASWNFVLWGALHGVALALHRLWGRGEVASHADRSYIENLIVTLPARTLTLAVVVVGWILFRCPTLPEAWTYISRMTMCTSEGVRMLSPHILGAILVVVGVHMCIQKNRLWSEETTTKSIQVRLISYSSLMVIISLFSVLESSPFIYFQF